MSLTRSCTSGGSGHPDRPGTTTSTDRRSLVLATSLRAMAGRGGNGGQSTTRSTPSINAAVDLGPGGVGPGDHGQPGQVDADVVGGDGTQPGEADERAPRAGPRRRGQEGQGQADAAAGAPGRPPVAGQAGDHDGASPAQAAVGEQIGQGWDHREESGLARGDGSGPLGQEGQGLRGPCSRSGPAAR